jgi:hypothetical protein
MGKCGRYGTAQVSGVAVCDLASATRKSSRLPKEIYTVEKVTNPRHHA